MYDGGQLFKLNEWHDSFVFDEVRKTLEKEKKCKNINISDFGIKDNTSPKMSSKLNTVIDFIKVKTSSNKSKMKGHTIPEKNLFNKIKKI